MFGYIKLDATNKTFSVSQPYWLDFDRHTNAKNFIPFLYEEKVRNYMCVLIFFFVVTILFPVFNNNPQGTLDSLISSLNYPSFGTPS